MISDFSKTALGDTFNGRNSLSNAFWVHFVYGQVVFLLAALVVGGLLYLLFRKTASDIFNVLIYPLAMIYLILALIGVWRCAFNVKHHIWGYAARGFVLIYGILVMLSAALSFA